MNAESYNCIAHKWTAARNKSFVSRLVQDFAAKIKKTGFILDIGCGSGYLTKFFCQKGFHVEAIDISSKMIEIAKGEHIQNAAFQVCDFLQYTTTRKYDGIIAWYSLFHFPKEKQKEIYLRAGRLLKPGGIFLFTHGDADDEHTDKMFGEEFYYSCIPKAEVLHELEKNNFKICYTYKNFIEQTNHRDLVILAKKKTNAFQN